MPAWFATQVATLAHTHREPGPIALQLEYSLVAREIEREHLGPHPAHQLGVIASRPQCSLASSVWSAVSSAKERQTARRAGLPFQPGVVRVTADEYEAALAVAAARQSPA